MFHGAVQGCCSVMEHCAYVTWGQNDLESCIASLFPNHRNVFLTCLQKNKRKSLQYNLCPALEEERHYIVLERFKFHGEI